MAEIIAIGSDHAGFKAKETVKKILEECGLGWKDYGTRDTASCDYPDYARAVAQSISRGEHKRGIIVCGSGIGVSMTANKVRGIRAALCHNEETARLSRQHNDSNVLCFGERTTEESLIPKIIKAWLEESFEGGRHSRRVDKMEQDRAGESGSWSEKLKNFEAEAR